jgi:hypothetical protein
VLDRCGCSSKLLFHVHDHYAHDLRVRAAPISAAAAVGSRARAFASTFAGRVGADIVLDVGLEIIGVARIA